MAEGENESEDPDSVQDPPVAEVPPAEDDGGSTLDFQSAYVADGVGSGGAGGSGIVGGSSGYQVNFESGSTMSSVRAAMVASGGRGDGSADSGNGVGGGSAGGGNGVVSAGDSGSGSSGGSGGGGSPSNTEEYGTTEGSTASLSLTPSETKQEECKDEGAHVCCFCCYSC